MIKRIFVDCILVFALFLVPWWGMLILFACAAFVFNSFYEMLILGLVIDSLYNAPIARFHHVEFVVTLCTVCIFIAIEVVKRRLRFYS